MLPACCTWALFGKAGTFSWGRNKESSQILSVFFSCIDSATLAIFQRVGIRGRQWPQSGRAWKMGFMGNGKGGETLALMEKARLCQYQRTGWSLSPCSCFPPVWTWYPIQHPLSVFIIHNHPQTHSPIRTCEFLLTWLTKALSKKTTSSKVLNVVMKLPSSACCAYHFGRRPLS